MNREERIEHYRELLREAIDHGCLDLVERELVLTDLFYLLGVICGRDDIKRSDFLYDRCLTVQSHPNGQLDLWSREHYKMLPLTEPVPTPTGWTTHGALEPGDWVFGPDGMPTRVVARTEVFTDGEAYELEFDDGTTMRAGADHLWTVERKTSRRVPGTHKEGAGKRVYREQVTLSTRDIATHDHRMDNRLAVPVNDQLVMPDALLPIPPYTLGSWLGDGHSRSPRLTCSYDDHQVVQEIRGEGIRAAECASPNENTGLYQLGDGVRGQKGTGLAPLLRALGILNNKHIPICYQRGSAAQRLALLQGLMDTDGHCNTRGTATFTNQTEALVDGVYELATGLGLKPTKRAYDPPTGRYWQVSFQAYQVMNPFRLERKAARAKAGARPHPRRFVVACRPIPSEPMSCIQVAREDGLYLAGKQMVTTHNSTIITFGKTIQDLLNDPTLTVGIFSHTKPIARGFLRQIKYELETNERLKQLFPDILYADPKTDAPVSGNSWSEDKGITVKRGCNDKESSVEAHGLVDGQPTSKHFKLLVYDDVVTLESVSTPEMIEKTTNALALSYNLGAHGGIRRFIGTRYHYADTYATIITRGTVAPRVVAATKDGTVDGEPVFLSREVLEQKRRDMGSKVFSCQMLQNPLAGGTQSFDRSWLKHWEVNTLAGLNLYLLVDPAHSKKKSSDYTVMAVIGMGADLNYYLVDMIRDRLNLGERTRAIFRLHRKYRPIKTGYERYGLQSDIEHFQEEMGRVNYRFEITELGGKTAKTDRISRLIPKFEAGRFFLPPSLNYTDTEGRRTELVEDFINDEYLNWPVSAHDDMLDCMARIDDIGGVFPIEEEYEEEHLTEEADY